MHALHPLLLTSLLLAACSLPSGQDPRQLKELPVSWKNAGHFPTASPQQDLSRWWRHFNDPTLNQIIRTSLANNLDLRSAQARIREARARRNAQAASLFPSLSGSTGTSSRANNPNPGPSSSSTSYSTSLDASWEADLFGRQRSNIEASAANLGAAQENLHSAHASLAAEIATTYTTIRTNQARLAIIRETLVTREETARLASWREQSGEADALEATQAKTSLESARASIPTIETAIEQDLNQLAFLSGQNPGSLHSLIQSSPRIPSPPDRIAVRIPADVVRQRPDVRIAGYQLLAAAASTRAADADRYPSLSLSGSLSLATAQSRQLFNPQSAAASLIAGISSPIFDGGRLNANLQAAQAAEEQALLAYRSSVLNALTETENALVACRLSASRLSSLEKAAQLAREADALARQRYEAGEIDFLGVLDSQRTLLSLEESLLSTRADRTISFIRLYQALGGGW